MKMILEEYGGVILMLIIFAIILTTFYSIAHSAATGKLLVNYQNRLPRQQ